MKLSGFQKSDWEFLIPHMHQNIERCVNMARLEDGSFEEVFVPQKRISSLKRARNENTWLFSGSNDCDHEHDINYLEETSNQQ